MNALATVWVTIERMASTPSSSLPSPPPHRQFATTRWSMVSAAGVDSSPEAKQALADLCTVYWYPLYAFLRRKNLPPEDAQDATQEFFVQLLEREILRRADRTRGKFRSFLLASLKHFLANHRRHAGTLKRGGGKSLLSLDFADGEERYRREPADPCTAETIFERRWALTVLEQTLQLLQAEFVAAGKGELFEALKNHLGGQTPGENYRALAGQLAMSEGAVKTAVHRLRKRYRELLHAEVAQTVTDPAEVKEELRELQAALSD